MSGASNFVEKAFAANAGEYAMPIFGEVAQIRDLHLDQPALDRPSDEAGGEDGPEELWKDRQDLDAHDSMRPGGSRSRI